MSAAAATESHHWYRVAPLRPRLPARAKLHRHRYRGELWYVLQDPASAQVHRFTPAARLLIAAMDGQRSVEDIWALARRHLGEDAPTQDELIQLLGQLHAADLLATDMPPDALELFERRTKTAAQRRRRSWANPMAVRIPLWDPGRFLDRFAPAWRRIWGVPGAVLWCLVVLPALALLPGIWPELTHNVSDRALQVDNLLLLAIVFPIIKALHELGHATATHAGGGEVHDMGVMLLVLMPVPYVEASAANALRSRWMRARVGAAGMIVELFIAAIALYLWLLVEPGWIRAVCFNVMLVAGVSTLIFNGNPLLRYDAYYVLADIAELPNLAQRSTRYWGYLIERHVLRNRDALPAAETVGERVWFTFYGAASTLYRIFVTVAIALFIGGQFFFIGVVLAIWAVVMMAVMPVVKAFSHLRERPGLRERRGRILSGLGAALAVLVLAAFTVPLPNRTQAEGLVWLPEEATLRAGTAGFVSSVLVAPGKRVEDATPVIRSVNPELATQLAWSAARVAELEAMYASEFVSDRARAEITLAQLRFEQRALERVRQRAAGLLVSPAVDGTLVLAQANDLPGRFLNQGEVIGHVLGEVAPIVRVVLEQAEVGGVGASVRNVELRLGGDVGRVIPGRIVRRVPAGSDQAPSAALVASGGGRVAADPRDPSGRKTLARVFEVDVAPLAPLASVKAYGQRVYVRFELEPATFAVQSYRLVRRLFLSHFDV